MKNMKKTLILFATVAVASSCSVMFSPDPVKPVPTYESPDPFIIHQRPADNRKEARDQFNRWNNRRPEPAKSYNLSGLNYRDNGVQSDFKYRDRNGKTGKITIISQPDNQPGYQQGRQAGYQQGYEQGYRQGYQQGRQPDGQPMPSGHPGYQNGPQPQGSKGQSAPAPAPTDNKQNYSRSAGPGAQASGVQPSQNGSNQNPPQNQQSPQNGGNGQVGAPVAQPQQPQTSKGGTTSSKSNGTTSSSKAANPSGGRRN